MNPNEICGHEECGRRPKSMHLGEDFACPQYGPGIGHIARHPVNRFTPRKEGQATQNPKCPKCSGELLPVEYPSNAMLNREQWQSVRAGDWFCSRCKSDDKRRPLYFWKKDFEAKAQPACPPGRLPFDLAKALKGARVVTRAGEPATGFRLRQGNRAPNLAYPYEADVDGASPTFTDEGTNFVSKTPSPFDLFLAGEDVTAPTAEQSSGVATEAETRRQAQSEIGWKAVLQRRIEVEQAALDGLTIQCTCSGTGWEDFCLSSDQEFDWANFNYRIKPAEPAGPRVVWIAFGDSRPIDVADKRFTAISPDVSQSKFIALDWLIANVPEVLSALKAAGIEVEKGDL